MALPLIHARSSPDLPGIPPALPPPQGTGQEGPRRRARRASRRRHHPAADEAAEAGGQGSPLAPVRDLAELVHTASFAGGGGHPRRPSPSAISRAWPAPPGRPRDDAIIALRVLDRKSTRLNSSH